jgi:hypothetical protein
MNLGLELSGIFDSSTSAVQAGGPHHKKGLPGETQIHDAGPRPSPLPHLTKPRAPNGKRFVLCFPSR